MKKIIQFSALILIALVTGVFWGTWFTLTRSLHDFSATEFIHIGKTIIANVAIPMRILMPASILFIMFSALQIRKTNRTSFYLYLVSFILIAITLIITVLVEVPIDNQIRTWSTTNLPENWTSLRDTWNQFHSIRTFASIASLGFFGWGISSQQASAKS
ncbi:MAG: anthrone oxygenase family protein [Flavisolibacter sp.]